MRHSGGERVGRGYYWDLGTLEVVSVPPGPGAALPGGPEDRFVRLPAPLALALGPILGGVLVVLLPAILVAAFLAFVGRALGRAGVRAFMEVATVLAPRWEPGVAYFASRRRAGAKPPGAAAPDALDALLEEIAGRRKERERADGDGGPR